jgi:hypothetical protein
MQGIGQAKAQFQIFLLCRGAGDGIVNGAGVIGLRGRVLAPPVPGDLQKQAAAGIPTAATVLAINYQIRVTTPAIAMLFAL